MSTDPIEAFTPTPTPSPRSPVPGDTHPTGTKSVPNPPPQNVPETPASPPVSALGSVPNSTEHEDEHDNALMASAPSSSGLPNSSARIATTEECSTQPLSPPPGSTATPVDAASPTAAATSSSTGTPRSAAPRHPSPEQRRLGVSGGRTAIQEPAARAPRGWLNGGFGAYMHEKERKLREQFAAEATPADGSSIFAGVTVWVTGSTRPPRTEIRRLLAEHGGKFETYLSREKVTHIVADNLATATRRRLAPEPGKPSPYTIVTAKWLVDSAQRGERQPAVDYAVPGMRDPAQKRVTALFGPRAKRARR